MTKVEIDGKMYCVETLIYTVERLTKDVKASAKHHSLVLDNIKNEITMLQMFNRQNVVEIIDKYRKENED